MTSHRWGWLLVGPHLLSALVFVYVPFVAVVVCSFTRFDGLSTPTWVGLDNYRWMISNSTFHRTAQNTVVLTAAIVVLTVALSVPVAAGIHRVRRFGSMYRVAYLVPMVVTPIAAATVWRWLYRPDDGLINQALRPFGVERVTWLTGDRTAIIAVAIVEVWMLSSFFIVVLIAALDAVPRDLYEACALDGAGPLRQFRHVTLPALRPLVWFTIIQSTLVAIRVYDVAVAMSVGNRRSRSTTLTMHLQDEAFVSLRLGRGSAIGVAMFACSLGVTVIQFGLATRGQRVEASPRSGHASRTRLGAVR